MKRQLLLTFAFSSLFLGQTIQSDAQVINLVAPTFLVNSPSNISGSKTFTMANNGDALATGNWGRAIDSFWYNLPIDTAMTDTLGCSNLPSGSLTGKFALVSRGTCDFSEKAYYAQQAGAVAVIIYNNIAGGAVGMAAGTNAGLVTIPVIMISQSDGLALKSEIAAGQAVHGSLTNWGFGFTHDLGIVNNAMSILHSYAIPKYELSSGSPDAYKVYTGALIANFGASAESSINLKSTLSFTPTGGTSSVLAQDSVVSSTTFNTIDSVIEVVSPNALNIPAINQTGTLDLTYNVTAANGDEQGSNNIATATSMVTDSIYSKGRLDANGKPIITLGYKYSDGTMNTWGPLYFVREGGHRAVKATFTVSDGGTNTSLYGNTVAIYVYKWSDVNGDKLINATELSMKGYGEKNFTTADTGFQLFDANLYDLDGSSPLLLDGNSWYWIAAEVPGALYFGVDPQLNYFMRSYSSLHATPSTPEFWAPQFPGSSLDLANSTNLLGHFPFLANTVTSADTAEMYFTTLADKTPSITLHTSKAVIDNIVPVASVSKNLNVYPNPAKDVVNIGYEFDRSIKDLTVTVIDGVGRTIYKETTRVNNNHGSINLNVANYASGSYFLVVKGDTKVLFNKFTVIK
ncbi:MAG TPA: PA domain-containing protein [Flavipsychrobacter sp.]|nr:PA domain-containing protein [Flavipsychrobacter sp.]